MKAEKELNELIAAKDRYEIAKRFKVTGAIVSQGRHVVVCGEFTPDQEAFIRDELKKIIQVLQDKAEIDLDAAESAYAAALTRSLEN